MTIAIPSNRVISAVSKAGGGFQSAGLVVAPSGFVAMIADDYSGATAGTTNSNWAAFGSQAEFSDVRSVSGTISTKIITQPSQNAPTCGGSTTWAAARNLLSVVPVGKTVWQRIFHYIPSSFSMGYAFGAGDSSAASTCGSPTDGGLMNLKWMRFSPDVTNGRIYVQPYTQRRQILQDANAGIRVITEAGGLEADHTSAGLSGAPFPRDQWFPLQLAVKVANTTEDGFIRAWMGTQMVAEITGINTVSEADSGLDQWGIGPYWNGQPWTDGSADRDEFWIDEEVVATDADGYEAPTGTDANGNAYIDPTTRVSDLS